jgi:ubiquitin-conjugating enzyme E2 H
MAWLKRAQKDAEMLRREGYALRGEEGGEFTDPTRFQALLAGPKGTAYEGGAWWVRFTIGKEYPFKSPSVGIVEPLWHPNVEPRSGSVCVDALGEKWQPVTTLEYVMRAVLPQLLTYPNPSDPLNADAAEEMMRSVPEFEAHAREWTAAHGKAKAP